MLDASQPASVFWVIAGIWGVVGIAFYVWYLWSLSRLFPYLGLPSVQGWIPIWNQWVLLERGGFPGALILLALIPGLGIVHFVLLMIGINRIHREFDASPVFILLAIFLPPVWAMVLTSYLEQLRAADRTGATGSPTGRTALAAATAPPPRPGVASPQYPSTPVSPAGAVPWQQTPPAPAPQAPAAPAAPVSSAFPVGQPAEPVAPAPSSVQVAPPAQDWGLSRTTEDVYQRLAEEGSVPQDPQSIIPETPARPFMWPEPEHLTDRPAPRTPSDAPAAPAAPPPAAAPPAVPAPATPIPADPVPDPAPAVPAEDDATVVVPRRVRWGLELPDLSVIEFPSEDVVVGRKPAAPEGVDAITVPDPTRTLSKTHARFRLVDEGWTIEDLGSTNGCATVDAEGVLVDLDPHTPVPASERLMIGTLEARLVRIDRSM